MALGKHVLAIFFIEFAMSRVISLTLFLFLEDILSNCSTMGFTLVPAKIPTIAPFLPLAFLLVIIV